MSTTIEEILAQRIVAEVLRCVGYQSTAEDKDVAVHNVSVELAPLLAALHSSDSVLSYIYHREGSKLTYETHQQVYEAMLEVERITRAR